MPKRGSDADGRVFFDELVSVGASRLKATGAIRLEDRHGIITFGDKQKLVGVSHTVFRNGGAWSYFICPRCGGRKNKLWLVDEAPRCLSCCWSLGVRYRSAYGFGRSERLRERDRYVDRVQDRRLRGRKRRLTMTMRRSMITCRLAQLAHQQKAKDGSDGAIAIHARLSASQSRNRDDPRSKATMESPNGRSPRTSPGSSANGYPGRSSIRRHASSNSRRKPHVENAGSATTWLDLRHP